MTVTGLSEVDYDKLHRDATQFYLDLRHAQSQMREGSPERKATGDLAMKIDLWCQFIEDTVDF